jgi:hypothetical protein
MVAMLTVPLSVCFNFGLNSGSNVFFEGFEGLSKPQTDEPPSLSFDPGPIGSPVWKEKSFCTLWTGA